MHAIQIERPALDAFRTVTLPDPVPQRGEVLIRQRAASLNFVDLAVATGQYPVDAFPLVPVCDAAGDVVAVGDDVTEVAIGDRVLVHAKPHWAGGRVRKAESSAMRGVTLPGALSELAVVPAAALITMPTHLDHAAAATLPIAATTAWNALQAARVGPGSVVLLLGTGVVSLVALQLAKARGATVVLTSSSDDKLAHARALGADHVINYRSTPRWDEAAIALTDGAGVDLVLETGGSATFAQSLNAATHGGTVFVIGFLSGTRVEADLLPIIAKALLVRGNNTGSVADLRDAVRAIAAAGIQPVIDSRFDIGETAAAYQRMQAQDRFGKVVIDVSH